MATTRITDVAVEAGLPPDARTRLTDVEVLAGVVAQGITRLTKVQLIAGSSVQRTRLTGVSVTSGPADTEARPRTRVTEVLVIAGPSESVGYTRITEVAVTAGPIGQAIAALPSVFWMDTDGQIHPYRVLTLDDYPWS